MEVRLAAGKADEPEPEPDETADGEAEAETETPKTAAELAALAMSAPAVAPAKPSKDGPVTLRSLDTFVEHFLTLGRKGIAVNRYKGLGEMNPETLWLTTMTPTCARCCRCGRKITPKPIRCSPR